MEKYFEKLIAHRRKLHTIPEIAFNEIETGNYIKQCLHELGYFNIQLMAKTGIIAEYRVNDGPYIAFRSDIDALKIKEETGFEFASKNEGYMHACGHDLHISMLLTLAEWIEKTKPEKNILLIFQPAEEGLGGGEVMVKEGLFDKFNVKEVYALHNTTEYPVGTIALNEGKMFAGTIEFEIQLEGKGGHAAVPHLNNDLITASVNLINLLNAIEPRFLDPIHENLLSIGMIHAGEAANILPSSAVIKGTVRSYFKVDLNTIKTKIKDMVYSISIAFGIKAKLLIHSEYIPAVNNKEIVKKIKDTDFGKGINVVDCPQKMTGEDFGFMLEAVPGAIAWLGAGNDLNRTTGLHNQAYNPDEKSMMVGFNFFKVILENFSI
ncbi:MAG: M20 family metallopeptidase [Candidatus Delongbacteria bacterium]|nr:M20 family metallopeptidase [Candidatus Delongbacteria bacterium]